MLLAALAAAGGLHLLVMVLATALLAALVMRQRASWGFWACAAAGCALVLAFAAYQGGGSLSWADGLLLLSVASASMGYVAGARVSAHLPAQQTICWVLVGSLPLTAVATALVWPAAPARASAWAGFAYVSLFSMWLGFFAWYRGLALGGVMRVSQTQLLQPFLALLFAVPLLGEPLEAGTLAFTGAIVAVVFLGRRMPIGAATR